MYKYIIAIFVTALALYLYAKGKKNRKINNEEKQEKGNFIFENIKYLDKNAKVKSRNVNSLGTKDKPQFEVEIVFSDKSSYKEIIDPTICKKVNGEKQRSINGYDLTVVEKNAILAHNKKMGLSKKEDCELNNRLVLLEQITKKN